MYAVLISTFSSFFNHEGKHQVCEIAELTEGMTNKTYRVRTKSNEYAVRTPGKGIGETINREDESFNTKVAYEAGVTPEVVYDEKNGNKVTRFLKYPVVMTPELLKQPNNILQAAVVLKKLHTAKTLFVNTINIFDKIREELALLQVDGGVLPDVYLGVASRMNIIEAQVKSSNITVAPCHNDATTSNFIFSEGKMHLIDFEYSANNDPLWDLAFLSMEAGFSAEQDDILLNSYFENNVQETDRQRYHSYKPVVEFVVTLWCLIQLKTIPNDQDKSTIAALLDKRFSMCEQLLKQHEVDKPVFAMKR